MWNTQLYSKKLAGTHFWVGTIGIIIYVIPMYWAGFTQSMMWKTFTEEGQLKFQFLETVTHIVPMYAARSVGGALYLVGAFIMVYNLAKTIKQGQFVANEAAEAAPLTKEPSTHGRQYWHRWIEKRPMQMLAFSLIAVAIGGLLELVPTFLIKSNIPTISSVKPYTPLELHGRDVYIREGCYLCHSQMIRPFRDEVARYGEYSKAGEFVYDHPFQWGSKRTGPDLARVGGKYPDSWHYNHMFDPQSMSPGSIMPSYGWLYTDEIDTLRTPKMIWGMKKLGVPYGDGYEDKANSDLRKQEAKIVTSLQGDKITAGSNKEIIALIAYLQRIGTDIKAAPKAEQGGTNNGQALMGN
jgi:cytochrome c oxidase cbb3-type subunit I/II